MKAVWPLTLLISALLSPTWNQAAVLIDDDDGDDDEESAMNDMVLKLVDRRISAEELSEILPNPAQQSSQTVQQKSPAQQSSKTIEQNSPAELSSKTVKQNSPAEPSSETDKRKSPAEPSSCCGGTTLDGTQKHALITNSFDLMQRLLNSHLQLVKLLGAPCSGEPSSLATSAKQLVYRDIEKPITKPKKDDDEDETVAVLMIPQSKNMCVPRAKSAASESERLLFYIASEMNDMVVEVWKGSRRVGAPIAINNKLHPPVVNQLWYEDDACFIHSALNDMVFWNPESSLIPRITMRALSGDARSHWRLDDWKVYNDNPAHDVQKVLDIRSNSSEVGSDLVAHEVIHGGPRDNQHFRKEFLKRKLELLTGA